ncbi:MAG: hypothetical protein ABS40_20450 [Agrobacterium sp. SCN 61-19]|nr:MAG: hypothetical protein ABS40_20450 [Agrobacterium sp. SCN 61-19]
MASKPRHGNEGGPGLFCVIHLTQSQAMRATRKQGYLAAKAERSIGEMVSLTRETAPIPILYSTTLPYASLGREAVDGTLAAASEANASTDDPFRLEPKIAAPYGVRRTIRLAG